MKIDRYDITHRVSRPALKNWVFWLSTEDEEKVSSAHLSRWSGKILITTDLGQDCLEIDRSSVAHINSKANAFHLEMPQDKLIQLMMGRRSIEDLAIEPNVSVTGEIIPVLEALFPLGHPHVWWPDRF